MKILYITPAFQHPAVRGSNRCYHFIKELSPRHHISLLTLRRSDIPAPALQEVQSYLREMRLIDAAGNAPARGKQSGKFSVLRRKLKKENGFRRAIREMRETFLEMVTKDPYDLVLFHGKSIFPVIEGWDKLPIVIDFCDATAMRLRERMRFENAFNRLLLKRRYRRSLTIEQKMLGKTPHVSFISSRDRKASVGRGNGFKIIPNGVDLEFWTRKNYHPQKNTIVLTGVMNYCPNEDAALYLIRKILPRVRPQAPGLKALIVGRDPTAALREAGEKYRDVIITGFVEDVRAYLERAAVFAAPLRYSSGIQNKVLEAFAMEVPVICTPVVAEGLCLDNRQEPPLRVAEGEEAFAAELLKLLADENERSRLAAAGRKYVEQNFVWSRSAELLEEMCLEAVEGKNHSKIFTS